MRVLEITTNISVGSVGIIVKELYGIINRENECVVAYGRGENVDCIKSYVIGNKFDVYIHALLTRITDKTGFYSKKSTKKFINYLNEYKPDIIHIHCVHGYYINLEILFQYIKEKDIPVVWTFHDCWAFTGHCAYFDGCGCEKWKSECYACEQKRVFPASFILDNSRWNYNRKKSLFCGINKLTIVTPSEWLSKLVKESFFSYAKIVTINNGIDTKIFKYTDSNLREKYNLREKKIVLGVANIWNERKGLNTFLKLADLLGDEYQIVIIGLLTKDIDDCSKRIITINRTQNKIELAKWYSVADIFVNPTMEDNYPTVNLEAIACGTSVVTYDTGGSAECLKYGNGALVPKGDVKKLIETIKDICENDYQKCKDHVGIDKEYCFKQYVQLFEEILDEKNKEDNKCD